MPWLALPAVLLALPASADWLVMQDGSRLETRGEWSVEGAKVLFTLRNGTLSTVRARDVDLEASEALTRDKEAEAAAVAEAADADIEVPDPVWTITDEDIPQAPIAPEEIDIEPLVGAEGFGLQDVEEVLDATGTSLVVRGVLINEADIPASLSAVRVLIVSPQDGGTLDVASAVVDQRELQPKTATRFSASFELLEPGYGVVQVEVVINEEEDLDLGLG